MVVSCATILRMKRPDLKALLRDRDMKLVDLARLVEVDKATITRWALKEIPADRVEEVARKTGISASTLRPDLAALFTPIPTPDKDAAA